MEFHPFPWICYFSSSPAGARQQFEATCNEPQLLLPDGHKTSPDEVLCPWPLPDPGRENSDRGRDWSGAISTGSEFSVEVEVLPPPCPFLIPQGNIKVSLKNPKVSFLFP